MLDTDLTDKISLNAAVKEATPEEIQDFAPRVSSLLAPWYAPTWASWPAAAPCRDPPPND